MNSVDKIAISLDAENEAFIHTLYSRWETFVEKHIVTITDRLLERCDERHTIIEIASLEVDLGTIREDVFDESFALLLEEKLEEALLKSLLHASGTSLQRRPESEHLADLLFQFLLHGSLPWHLTAKYRDIGTLFKTVLQQDGERLKSFLQTYGHYTSLQRRLVYQLGDAQLEEGIRLLAPGESTFIRSYVRFLRAKYRQLERPSIRETDHRNAVWQVVYAYLLNNQSSWFSRKRFVTDTIARLAAHYNLSYPELLAIVTGLPEQFSERAIPSGLSLLLTQLKQEVTQRQLQEALNDPESWYRLLTQAWNDGREVQLDAVQHRALRTLLARENSALTLLKRMQETAIIRLVKLVVPHESAFVIMYASSLDTQQESGVLQGKAGGEFRIFKWQVLFPLLLTATAASFNRKQLVWKVLERISAHYNLAVEQLLDFLYRETAIHKVDRRLGDVLSELYNEIRLPEIRQTLLQRWHEADEVAAQLHRELPVAPEAIEQLRQRFQQEAFREALLDALHEKGRFFLLRTLFAQESRFLEAYAIALDVQQQNGLLEGKTGGRLKRMKWTFIYAVLYESRHQSFNAKHVVSRVLGRMAAHYNVAYGELLAFFHAELVQGAFAFPFDLVQIITALHREQSAKQHTAPVTSTASEQQENVRQQARSLLFRYFGKERVVRELIELLTAEPAFVRFLDPVLQAGMQLRRFLQATWNLTVSDAVLLRLLVSVSQRHRHLSRAEIMQQLLQLLSAKLTAPQQTRLLEELEHLAVAHPLLKAAVTPSTDDEPALEKAERLPEPETQPEPYGGTTIFVQNAGMVLLAPFFPRLFAMLELTTTGKFADRAAQIRAMFLLQYAVFGTLEFPEHELELNKLLTGFQTGIPVPRSIELADSDKETVDSLLKGALQHWGKLTNTTPQGLQEGFLRREGRLEEHDDFFQLTVEEKAYDMLLDNVPWNFKTIKYSWMEKAINVKWR